MRKRVIKLCSIGIGVFIIVFILQFLLNVKNVEAEVKKNDNDIKVLKLIIKEQRKRSKDK